MIYHLVVGGMCVILYIFYSSNMSNGLLGFASDVSDYLLDRRSDSLLCTFQCFFYYYLFVEGLI